MKIEKEKRWMVRWLRRKLGSGLIEKKSWKKSPSEGSGREEGRYERGAMESKLFVLHITLNKSLLFRSSIGRDVLFKLKDDIEGTREKLYR